MKKGFIISLEGGEACGKTTQRNLLEQYFKEKGIDYIVLREPGGTEIGEKIRQLLFDKNFDLNYRTETLLLNASRSELCEKVIKPAYDAGKVILLDRFYHSTLVYQGYSIGNAPDTLMPIIDFATQGMKPNLTIYFHLPAETSYQRKQQENKQDRFEARDFEYYKKVAGGFEKLAKRDKLIVQIDARQTIEEIHKQVVKLFEERYKNAK